MDRQIDASGFGDPELLPYLEGEQTWASEVTAEACYDPALRTFRRYLDSLVTAFSKIPAGVSITEVSLEDLMVARDALEAAINQYTNLSAQMTLAASNCD